MREKMSNYRNFQPETTSRVRESIEWSVTYTYGATDEKLPRVLLIGDSICNGYQGEVRARLDTKANVTFWASSKCVTDRDYFRELDLILGGYDFDFISFNNGLHSLTTDASEWEQAYRRAVEFITAKCPDAKLVLTLCTALNDSTRNEVVKRLNSYTKSLAEELGIPTLDLFTPTDSLDKNAEMTDVFHFRDRAKAMQADLIAAHIASRIELGENGVRASSETGPDGRI